MREPSLSPTRIDPAHPRRDMLTSEARRLARRRTVALAVAARCRRFAAEAIDPEPAMTVRRRMLLLPERGHELCLRLRLLPIQPELLPVSSPFFDSVMPSRNPNDE